MRYSGAPLPLAGEQLGCYVSRTSLKSFFRPSNALILGFKQRTCCLITGDYYCMDKADVIILFQDSQGISSKTAENMKTIVKKMITKLSAGLTDTDVNFALAKYATSRRMSCFGSADETINYLDNEYQHEGSGLNLLKLALSKMVLKQFGKRPDDRRTDDTSKVSFSFGYFLFWSEIVVNKFKLSSLSLTFIFKFGENTMKSRPQLYSFKTR